MIPREPRLFLVAQEQTGSDDYYTPGWIFEKMGIRFDLDVCAPPGGCPQVPADRYFTMADDGLASDWHGRVWMNPPYSKPSPWVDWFMEHRHGVCLVPHSKGAWHCRLMADADVIVIPPKYFDFVGGGIFLPVFFAAYGSECVEAASTLGAARVLQTPVVSCYPALGNVQPTKENHK